MVKSIIPVVIIIYYSFNRRVCCQHVGNCGWKIKSDCDDNITTKWNHKNIKKNLKNWIESISQVDASSDEDPERVYLDKTLLTFDEKDIITNEIIGRGVQFIGNIDCSKNKHVGPTWRKPSIFSMRQFHDGFLYGVENKYGKLTGRL